jgi:hypothetical protein
VGAWPAFTNQQVADAKARACAAYTTVRTGVSPQSHATGAADPVATPAVAVDARLSEVAGAQYLLNRLDPATPPPLAAAIHTFADDLLDIAANALAGAPNDDPAQAGRLRDGETASAHSGSVQMSQICLHRGTYFETGTSTACCRRSTRPDVSSPKVQCKSGRPALRLSRHRLRTPARARHLSQSSTGQDTECLAEFPLRRPGRTGGLLKCSAALAITLPFWNILCFNRNHLLNPIS